MPILLDTHILLWFLLDSPRLGARARKILDEAGTRVFFSPVSILEIAIKHALKPEVMPCDPDGILEDALGSGLRELPFTSVHARGVGGLPWVHRDPFDRMLLAQARAEGILLLTCDAPLLRYGDGVIEG